MHRPKTPQWWSKSTTHLWHVAQWWARESRGLQTWHRTQYTRPSSPVMFFRPLELSANCSHVLTDGGVGAHVNLDRFMTAPSSSMSPRRQMSAMQASP
jgi:hypothetical protein